MQSSSLVGVAGSHLAEGTIEQVSGDLYSVSVPALGVEATIRLLSGRAIVEFSASLPVPNTVPSSPLLRAQLDKYGHAFYASAGQLDRFLTELTGTA